MKTLLIISLSALLLLAGCQNPKDRYIEQSVVIQEDERLKAENIEQNQWIYSSMQEQYYWNETLPASEVLNFGSSAPLFFSSILYSGDRFSWIEPHTRAVKSNITDDYGIDYQSYLDNSSNHLSRVVLVVPHSWAWNAGIRRGDWFRIKSTRATGMDLTLGSLKDGKFVAQREVSMSSSSSTPHTAAILLDSVYHVAGRRVGYIFYNQFLDASSSLVNPYRAELREVFESFKRDDISDFVIDLRYNPGGYVSVCQFICSLILPQEYLGQISGYHQFNKILAQRQEAETGQSEETLYFPGQNVVGGSGLGLRRIYAIVSGKSFSASESLLNSLDPCIEVIKVGTTTGGKGVGSWTIQDNAYKWQIQPITFRYFNKNHVTVPDTGLTPDIVVDETSTPNLYQIGDSRELLLSAVLETICGYRVAKSSGQAENLQLRVIHNPELPRRNVSGYLMEK